MDPTTLRAAPLALVSSARRSARLAPCAAVSRVVHNSLLLSCGAGARRARPPLRVASPRQAVAPRARPRHVVCAAADAAPAPAPRKDWWLQIGGDDDPRLPPPESLAVVASRLGALAKEDAPLLAVASVFMTAAAAAELAIPTFLSRAIAAATASADAARFRAAVHTLLALAVAFGVLSGARGATFSYVNQRLVRRLRERLFAALASQPVSFFDAVDVGELTSRLGADSAAVARAVCTNVNVLARNALQVLFGGVLLARLSPQLAAAAAGVTLLLWLATERYGRFSRRAARALQDATAGANRVAEETFALVRTVRAAGSETAERTRYSEQIALMYDINSRQSAAYGIYVTTSNTLYHLANATALALAGAAALSGGAMGLSTETLITFMMTLELVLCASLACSDQWPSICDALGAGERVLALAASPSAPQLAAGVVPPGRPAGLIELRDVWFSYPGRPPALRGVSLTLRPGETVALVGGSGSGKTTLAALLQRLYDPDSGTVSLDGTPLTELDAPWFRRQLGVVAQEPRLFSDTVARNIAHGCAGTVTQAQIEAAAGAANAHAFISALPQGYETMVGAGGLSGGQRQRIAIARALVREPSLLILDEATSALDAESEALVQAALDSAMSGGAARRTCLVIAHRLSTVRRADRIVVLHAGCIAEEGTHEALVRHGGIYAQLVRKQQSGIDDADMAPHSPWPRVVAPTPPEAAPAGAPDEAQLPGPRAVGEAAAAPTPR